MLYAQWQDWKYQVTKCVNVAYTPPDPDDYDWQVETNDFQGIHIHLAPTEIVDIYVEAGNAKIDFCFWLCEETIITFLNHFEINIDNTGWQELYHGSPRQNYVWDCRQIFTQIGNHNIQVKYILASGATIYLREYNIKVVPKSDFLFKDQYANTMRVWKSQKANATPIVLATGFDAYNTRPEQYYRGVGANLFNCLLEEEYDIYVLFFRFNPQDLRNNAAVYSSAISYISESYYNNQKLIAAGMSMGGVISRYALAKAESESNPLPVKTWFSLDAPHLGAVINKKLQDTLADLQSDNFSRYALECDAAKILLLYNYYDNQGLIHDNFYNELSVLNGDGYPHLTNNICVSFSNQQPNPNSGIWLEINGNVGNVVNIDIALEPNDLLAGSYLPRLDEDPSVVTVAWGLFWLTVTMNQLSDPTFIPHLSSVDNYNSNFDDIIVPSMTYNHSRVPDEIINPLLYALKYPKNVLMQNSIINGTKDFIARNNIFAGKQVDPNQVIGDVVINENSNVILQAGNSINLKDGFHANYNFNAMIMMPEIVNCNTSVVAYAHSPSEKDRSFITGITKKGTLDKEINNESLNQIEHFSTTKIYPNPADDILNIILNNPLEQTIDIKIYNSTGIIVNRLKTKNDGVIKLDLSDFVSGVYTIQITLPSGVESFKFIVR